MIYRVKFKEEPIFRSKVIVEESGLERQDNSEVWLATEEALKELLENKRQVPEFTYEEVEDKESNLDFIITAPFDSKRIEFDSITSDFEAALAGFLLVDDTYYASDLRAGKIWVHSDKNEVHECREI